MRISHALRTALVLLPAVLAACVSVDVGQSSPPLKQFHLEDAGAAQAARAQRLPHRLVIVPMPAATSADSHALLYSNAPQQRAAYQFASWTERPSQQIAQLLLERLAARASFESVALLGRGIGGDLQLNLTVREFLHDATSAPGRARILIDAELVDRDSRRLLARRAFSAEAPLATADAAGAVRALSQATREALDQLVPWLEGAAAPPRAAR